jgi:REase_DpnII-MboI
VCSQSSDAHREWFGGTIRKGLAEGQFRTALPKTAAFAALKCLAQLKATDGKPPLLDLASLASHELMLAAAIDLAFGSIGASRAEIEQEMLNHILRTEIAVSDVTEAATLFVSLQRIRDKISLISEASTPADRILTLCRRFPLLVERLQTRQRGRAPLEIADEYDVQDLLHGMLKLHFDDVRPEEHTPSYGGSSSRVDFFLPKERIVVEAKMTRQTLGQKEVVDQLIIDATRYAQMDGVDTLICLIYDPSRRCANPKTVETDVERAATRLAVRAVICPQGL